MLLLAVHARIQTHLHATFEILNPESTSNGAEKKMTQIHTCTTSKRIELESCGWSGLVRF